MSDLQYSVKGISITAPKPFCGDKTAYFETPDGLKLWFSYETCIAFETATGNRTIIQNYWSNTTGKHLNAIDSIKKLRVDKATFQKRLELLGQLKRFEFKYLTNSDLN